MLGNLNNVVVAAGHQLVDLLQALVVVLDEESTRSRMPVNGLPWAGSTRSTS